MNQTALVFMSYRVLLNLMAFDHDFQIYWSVGQLFVILGKIIKVWQINNCSQVWVELGNLWSSVSIVVFLNKFYVYFRIEILWNKNNFMKYF